MTSEVTDASIADAVLALLAEREPSASICPSEVARSLQASGWRALMPRVRVVAAELAFAGEVRITQGTHEVEPGTVLDDTVRGPLRLRRPR